MIQAEINLAMQAEQSGRLTTAPMGTPVWVLLGHVPAWRWMLDRTDSPWYPTMRLFRQPAIDDWSSPIAQLALALRELVDK